MKLTKPAGGILATGIAAVMLAIPSAAGAVPVTASGVDPTGDATVTSNDITNLGVSFDRTNVTATITTNTALPASLSNWGARILTVQLEGGLNKAADLAGTATTPSAAENFGSFTLDSAGLTTVSGSEHGDVDQCDLNTFNITGTTVSLTAPSACFGYPGSVALEAEITDGTTAGTDLAVSPNLTSATSVNATINATQGYYALAGDGGVFAFGNAKFYGSTGNLKLNQPVVGMSSTPNDGGYRFVASDGGVFSYGDARFLGSMATKPLNKPIVGMRTTPSGNGYWLVASDGGIFAFGDAGYFGSTGSLKLNKPIVGMAATPSGNGYWLVASDGGIFAFGDAHFFGSTGSIDLTAPVVGMSRSTSGNGYAIATKDGNVYAFGDEGYHGSGTYNFGSDVVGIASSNGGYDLVGANGDIFNYGQAYDFGDPYRYNVTLNKPLVGLSTIGG